MTTNVLTCNCYKSGMRVSVEIQVGYFIKKANILNKNDSILEILLFVLLPVYIFVIYTHIHTY